MYSEGRRLKCNLSRPGTARRPDMSDCTLPREMMIAKIRVLTSDAMSIFTAAGQRMLADGVHFGPHTPAMCPDDRRMGLSSCSWDVTFFAGSLCVFGAEVWSKGGPRETKSIWDFYVALDSFDVDAENGAAPADWKNLDHYVLQPMAGFMAANTSAPFSKGMGDGLVLYPSHLDCVYMATIAARKMRNPVDKVSVLKLSIDADRLKSTKDTAGNACE